MKIKMAWADIDKTAKAYVNDVLDSGWLSRRKYMPRFESEMAKLHGQKYGLMVNSGTDALRIALATLKEVHRWPDRSEVIIPSVTFVATANVVLQNGLLPKFVDVDRFTYNIKPDQIARQITPSTVAVIAVHLFGLPADMPAIMQIAQVNKLKVIEDSCETIGVHKIVGDMAAFSTYMAHMIQTGVGGVLTTSNPIYECVARSYMNHGRTDNPNKFEFERIGYSSRVTEMEAALGCAQLERFEDILTKRNEIAWELWNKLIMEPYIQCPIITKANSWMLFPIVMLKGNRDKMMSYLLERGIESRQMMPLTNQKPYRHLVKKGEFTVAEWINRNGFCLPCHQLITDKEIDYMAETVNSFFK